MSARAYGIPLMQALALVTTQTACGDLMLGTWEGTRFEQFGYSYDLPMGYDYGYSAYGTQIYLTLTRDSVGSLDIVSTYTGYGRTDTYNESFALTADRLSNGIWDVRIPDFTGLTMNCIADREVTNCIGTNDDGPLDLDFKRVE